MSEVIGCWIEENEEAGCYAAFEGFDREMCAQETLIGYDDMAHEEKIQLFALIVIYLERESALHD
jgi:hypothetical protein